MSAVPYEHSIQTHENMAAIPIQITTKSKEAMGLIQYKLNHMTI